MKNRTAEQCLALGDDNCLKVPEDIDVTDELQVLEELARWHEESARTNYTFVSTLTPGAGNPIGFN